MTGTETQEKVRKASGSMGGSFGHGLRRAWPIALVISLVPVALLVFDVDPEPGTTGLSRLRPSSAEIALNIGWIVLVFAVAWVVIAFMLRKR